MLPRLYSTLASWWPLLSPPTDYAVEAHFYADELVAACRRRPVRLLELGSGGGNNASHMKRRFDLTLVDLSPQMLAVSRALNPECRHVEGDMRTVRLDERFDLVFVHDAASFLVEEADLCATLTTAAAHLEPGGAVLFAPDHTRESFVPAANHGGNDADGRALRYLEWTWDPDPDDDTYLCHFAILMRDADGTVTNEHDAHVLGMLSRDTWLSCMREAGFDAEAIPCPFAEAAGFCGEVFIGTRR